MSPYTVRPVRVGAFLPAPPEVVFPFVADTRNDPIWCSNVDSVEAMTDDPLGVGSRFRFRQHLDLPRGRRVEFEVDVTVVALGDRSITWHTVDRFQTRAITITVTPREDGSDIEQVTAATFIDPPGLRGWMYPVLARRTLRRQFAALANHLA